MNEVKSYALETSCSDKRSNGRLLQISFVAVVITKGCIGF